MSKELSFFKPHILTLGMFVVSVVKQDFTAGLLGKERYFETHEGFQLVGHVFETLSTDAIGCGMRCLRNGHCRSYNSKSDGNRGNMACELSNQTRLSNPDSFRQIPGFTYFEKTTIGWHSYHPAHSCKHIRDTGDSKGDGEYWIDPEKSGKPLKVYCDMTTDGGGWLLVYNVVVTSSTPSQLTVETSYRGISNYQNNKMILNTDAMKQLREHLSFTQLRFHCSKAQLGRTFHVTTAANSSGEAVVQFFSGQANVYPHACGSFVPLDGDNSYLAARCAKWGLENGIFEVGKWGHEGTRALNKYPAFIKHTYHWTTSPEWSRWECDDYKIVPNTGDWKIYVR